MCMRLVRLAEFLGLGSIRWPCGLTQRPFSSSRTLISRAGRDYALRSGVSVIVAVLKEMKSGEDRVALTPEAVNVLVEDGHAVLIEKGAGRGSGVTDDDYRNVGAEIVEGHEALFSSSDLLTKVKEIVPEEYGLLKEGRILFSYLHLTEGVFGAKRMMAEALLRSGVVAFSYETVQLDDGSRPLLAPMSEMAGHMGVIVGAHLLQKPFLGKGVMLGRMAGCRPAEVVVIGGGSVGAAAAKAAIGLGANVTVLDINVARLKKLQEMFGNGVTALRSNRQNVERFVSRADVVVNAVFYTPTVQRGHIVTKEMVMHMEPGSVIVDVGCDEEGAIETCRPTTHENPTYVVEGVVHYCVPNIPGAVPRTASYALSGTILPYVRAVAKKGWIRAIEEDKSLLRGLNSAHGRMVHKEAAECQGLEWYSLEKLLSELRTKGRSVL